MASSILSENTTGVYTGAYTGIVDTFIDEGSPTTNNETGIYISISNDDSTPDDQNGLIQFSTALDNAKTGLGITGSDVSAVEVGFYVAGGTGLSRTSVFKRVLQSVVLTEATWNIYSTGNNWGTAGAELDGTDKSATQSGRVVFTSTGAWYTMDSGTYAQLLTDVQNYLDGSITDLTYWFDSSGTGDKNIVSSDHTDGLRPYMQITYSSGSIVSVDSPVIDGEQDNSLTTTGFSGEINSLTIKTAGSEHTLDVSSSIAGSSGTYTFDMPDISGYTSATAGIPFDTASWGSKIVTAGDGSTTDTDTIVINPKPGWSVVEIASASTAEGSIFSASAGWTGGTPTDTCQVYYDNNASDVSIAADGTITFSTTTGTQTALFFDESTGLWDSFDIVYSAAASTAAKNNVFLINYLGWKRHVSR